MLFLIKILFTIGFTSVAIMIMREPGVYLFWKILTPLVALFNCLLVWLDKDRGD